MWDSMYPYGYETDDEFSGRINAQVAQMLAGKRLLRLQQQAGIQQAAAAPYRQPTLRPGVPRPGFRPSPAAMAAAAPAVAAAARLPTAELARGDDVIYGLDSGTTPIAAGATASLTTTPQKRHIPKRIFCSQIVANNFVLSDIRVGVEPVLATTANISLAVFVQDSTSPPFRAVICEIGMDFTVVVTNVGGAGARFVATVLGTYLPPNVC